MDEISLNREKIFYALDIFKVEQQGIKIKLLFGLHARIALPNYIAVDNAKLECQMTTQHKFAKICLANQNDEL